MCLFSFHIKVTGLKCLQEDATISQVSWEYILQCNIGEVQGRAFQTRHVPARPLAPPHRQGAPTAGGQTALILSCLSVCLRTDSHTQPPRQTNGGQAAALAGGLATPGARRVSVRRGEGKPVGLLSSHSGHRHAGPSARAAGGS